MSVEWTPHRFSGGVLALDVANTVVLRADEASRFDRFDDPREIGRFATVASRERSAEIGGAALGFSVAPGATALMIGLREAIDGYFRDDCLTGRNCPELLAVLLERCADGLRASNQSASLVPATARSALILLDPERRKRIRICDNCGWLFLDRSRNGSRRWCDMAVCGNRQKASRHYRRVKASRERAA